MTTTTYTKTPRTIIAAATSNAAGAATRGTVDLRTALGGFLTIKLTNGGTGPTIQAGAKILIAHNSGATPTAASAGTDWKQVWSAGNGIVGSATSTWGYEVPAGAMHLEVEVSGNTGQAVTCEAFLSELTNAATV